MTAAPATAATTATVEGLLKELQNAVGARALYPADHPRTRDGIERLEREILELTASRGELSVFAVDEKVVHDGATLPGSEPLARGLFRILKACGYDRLTIRSGVSREELDGFVAQLAEVAKRVDGPPPGALKPTANIRLSVFQQSRPGAQAVPLTEEDFFAEEARGPGRRLAGSPRIARGGHGLRGGDRARAVEDGRGEHRGDDPDGLAQVPRRIHRDPHHQRGPARDGARGGRGPARGRWSTTWGSPPCCTTSAR